VPRSVSVKIIDPVFEFFFFNKHWKGNIANPKLDYGRVLQT
jgi:hypothetical protein